MSRRSIPSLPSWSEAADFVREVGVFYDLTLARMPPVSRVRAMARVARNQFGPWRGPTNLLIAVTDRCQCACRHCGIRRSCEGGRDLPLADIRRILSEFRALGGVKFFVFGGEPLLRNDVAQIVAHATSLGLATVLNTNGILLDAARARELARAGLCVVEVSLDSVDPDRFAAMRGSPGILQRVTEAIRTSRAAGLPVGAITYAYRENLHGGLADIAAFCRREGVRSVRVLEPIASGRWESAHKEVLTPDELALLARQMVPGFVHGESQGRKAGVCSAVRGDMLHVGADGRIQPCAYVPHRLGNALEEPLSAILPRLAALRQYGIERPGCPVNDPEFRRRFGLPVEAK